MSVLIHQHQARIQPRKLRGAGLARYLVCTRNILDAISSSSTISGTSSSARTLVLEARGTRGSTLVSDQLNEGVLMLDKPKCVRGNPQSQRDYNKWHYQQNKDKHIAKSAIRNKAQREKLRAYINDYLKDKSCIDCGESDRIVLDFDHRPGEIKKFNLGDAASNFYSLKTVMVEIAKCDIRCANCHRRITYKRRKSVV